LLILVHLRPVAKLEASSDYNGVSISLTYTTQESRPMTQYCLLFTAHELKVINAALSVLGTRDGMTRADLFLHQFTDALKGSHSKVQEVLSSVATEV
jgi:hypothetical protein